MAMTVRVHRASTRGGRQTMEDRDIVLQRRVAGRRVTLVAVFDGHGGPQVSERAAVEFAPRVLGALDAGCGPREALERACAEVAALCAVHAHVGSTACAALVADASLAAIWLGDSQLVVATPDAVRTVATAHRLTDAHERARVLAAGADIEGPYVMRGEYGLMVTRSLGDSWFHPVGVIAEPSILTVDVEPGPPQLVVLATDGLWDVVPPATVAGMLARHQSHAGFDYARALMELALTMDTHDNVAIVSVELRA